MTSSGIAALLLIDGQTAHSCFKIPINIHKSSLCEIKKNSQLADLIKNTDFVIWDEAPMQSRHIHEAVDCTFQDIRSSDHPFEGLCVVFGGALSRFFLLLSKKIGLKLLESLYSALLFGSLFRFSSSHKICGLIQQTNESMNLHNGSWMLGMVVTQMKMEILSYRITFTAQRTRLSHS